MDDVILTHKPRQLNVAAQLNGSTAHKQPWTWLKVARRNTVADHGITLAGLLFGRRGLGLLGRSGRVEYS